MTQKISPEQYAQIRKETDDAIARGLEHSAVEWREMALGVVYDACMEMPTISVNDIRARIRASDKKTHDERAIGGVLKTAEKMGWVMNTGMKTPSLVAHLVLVTVWRSKLFKGEYTPPEKTPDGRKVHRI